ncbi:AraC family transcriptional regulator [Micromonospora zhanjiangensis]|uniref:AraC family transcriptional regulator n=1 Tax=Micromonospora zhanjiangensis TaxID=1522057 RepID=A0ABV8KUA5_9ACTN
MDVLSDAVVAMRTGRPHSGWVRRQAPFGTRFPAFDGAGFHVVLRGSCWLLPGDGAPVALGTGDVVLLPRGTGHGLADSLSTRLVDAPPSPAAADGRTNDRMPTGHDMAVGVTHMLCGAYLLDRFRPHPLLGELPEVVHLPARVGRHTGLRAAVDLLDEELENARPGADAMMPALLDVLLLHILRTWLDDRREHTRTGWSAALRDPAVAAALRAIHDAPGHPWTVQKLGARAGLSRAAIARRFTGLVGQPPLTYLAWWRMTLAARLLRDGDTPVAAIARRVGYASESAFAHAFKRAVGVAPGAFRRSAPGR